MSFQEAKYAQQTSNFPTTLTRHGDRYGLQSDAMNAQDLHQKYHPETPLLLGSKATYTMGQLPFSTTKEGVAKVLNAWRWDARPRQPREMPTASSGPSRQLKILLTGSMPCKHGDVFITKQQPQKIALPSDQFAVIASKKTLEHLGNQDPWLQTDPWQKPQAQPPSSSHMPAAPPGLFPAQLATMEANVEKKLLSNLQVKASDTTDATMEPSALETRVAQLEQQLSQVHKVGSLQAQIDKQGQVFGQALDMDKIESLLTKRARLE